MFAQDQFRGVLSTVRATEKRDRKRRDLTLFFFFRIADHVFLCKSLISDVTNCMK